MRTRIQIALDAAERSGLIRLAEKEMRDPRDQLKLILRQELERRGLWPAGNAHDHQAEEAAHE